MFNHRNITLYVGCTFFAVMGFIAYLTIVRTKEKTEKTPVFYPLVLESAEGLRQGAAISILGVSAGSVDSLYLISPGDGSGNSDSSMVVALLAINQPVTFYSNYRIITRYPTALGAKIIEIDPGRKKGPEDRPLLPRYLGSKELVAMKKTGLVPELGNTVLIAANFDDPLYMIATTLAENRKPIRKITRNLAEITGKMNSGSGTIASILNRPDLADGSNEILKGAIILIQEIRDGVEDSRESRAAIDFIFTITAFLSLGG
ncbi:MAG: MCE family protein [Leptospirales bacterium]|nr:MCE family protein [Leptospirales bacterium]